MKPACLYNETESERGGKVKSKSISNAHTHTMLGERGGWVRYVTGSPVGDGVASSGAGGAGWGLELGGVGCGGAARTRLRPAEKTERRKVRMLIICMRN